MVIAYKGVAPGTYYDHPTRNPSVHGFAGDPAQPNSRSHIIRHITAHSWPSYWVSVTLSFAVASDYATSDGLVYEIDLARIPAIDITDTVAELASARHIHQHDGHQDLIKGIADPGLTRILTAFPMRPGVPPTARAPAPNVSPDLHALVFTVRDAELLIASIPGGAVGHAYRI